MSVKSSRIYMLVIVGVLLLCTVGCSSEAAPTADEQGVAPTPVDVLRLEGRDFLDTFDVLGTAQPVESVHAASDVPGRILEVFAEEGDKLKRGQALFRVDVEIDAAGVEVLETQVAAAERELDRIRQLRQEGLATAQQLDAAETDVANARQSLKQRQISVSRDRVVSPINGYLSMRYVERGEFAGAGSPLAEIIDFDTIVVYAQVPESQVRYVTKDRTLDVYFPSMKTSFEGTVHRVALRATDTSRTYRVEIRIDNKDHRIRPGMRARLRFERELYEGAITVPREAILQGFGAQEAMVVVEDGGEQRAEVRKVRLGPGADEEVLVVEGLRAGERLIWRGHRSLVQGALVEVITEEAQLNEQEEL